MKLFPRLIKYRDFSKFNMRLDRSAIYIEMKGGQGRFRSALPLSVVELIVQHDLLSKAVVVSFDLRKPSPKSRR